MIKIFENYKNSVENRKNKCKIKEKALGGKQNENDYYWLLGERPITTNVQFGLSADDEKCSVTV